MRYAVILGLLSLLCGCAGSGAGTLGPGAIVPQADQNARQAAFVQARPTVTQCPASGSSGILVDGDFSQAPYPGGFESVSKGATFAPDWTSSGPQGIDFIGTYFATPRKLCSIDLDGTPGPGGIEHSAFPTTIGATYSVTFLFSGNGACSPNEKLMQIDAAGKTKQFSWDLATRGSAQSGDYRSESWSFTAIATTTTLKIFSKDPANSYCGPVVAAIAVKAG